MHKESAAEAYASQRAPAVELMQRYDAANRGVEGEETAQLMEHGHAERTPDGIRLTAEGHRVLRQYADMYPAEYKKIHPKEAIERSHGGS